MPISYCHNLLVDSLIGACRELGIESIPEQPAQTEDGIGFIDLVVRNHSTTVAMEVERSNRRILGDLEKAAALPADLLIIVVPNPQVKRLVKKRLRQINKCKKVPTFVACLPEAITRLRDIFRLQLMVIEKKENNSD